jgi:hypothetical protein
MDLRRRLDEVRARAMVRVANRSFTKQPRGLDRIAHRVVAKAATPTERRDPRAG